MSTPSSSIPSTMRAWTFSSNGSPDRVLSFNPNFPSPSPPKGSKLLIRISHVGLSSAGLNLMRDVPSILRKNAIPEIDFSGLVVMAGPSAPAKFTIGTDVFGTVSKSGSVLSGSGTLAEFILLEADCVAVKPGNMTFREAAGLSSLAQVALEMVRKGKVEHGSAVLVNGGSGGVGSAAVQLVKAMGATVIASCSSRNVEMVRGLGADEVIDYSKHTALPEYLASKYGNRQFDAILDTVGSQQMYKQCPKYLKADGKFVNVGTVGNENQLGALWRWAKNTNVPSILGGVPRDFIMFSAPLSGEGAEYLAELVERGKLRVIVDSVFKFEDVLQAYERSASGKTQGKVVVEVTDFDKDTTQND